MQIVELRLKTADLRSVRDFYHGMMKLPILHESPDVLTLRAGRTRLTFNGEVGWQGRYHLAFDVPENQITAAAAWIQTRARLATSNEQVIFQSSDHWNANMVYFYDTEGNILELIARHNQANSSEALFGEDRIISISEIGVGTMDVQTTTAWLCETLGAAVYDGAGSESFTAVGDELGLFIVVKAGRIWYPNTGIPAGLYPVDVTVVGLHEGVFTRGGHRIVVQEAVI